MRQINVTLHPREKGIGEEINLFQVAKKVGNRVSEEIEDWKFVMSWDYDTIGEANVDIGYNEASIAEWCNRHGIIPDHDELQASLDGLRNKVLGVIEEEYNKALEYYMKEPFAKNFDKTFVAEIGIGCWGYRPPRPSRITPDEFLPEILEDTGIEIKHNPSHTFYNDWVWHVLVNEAQYAMLEALAVPRMKRLYELDAIRWGWLGREPDDLMFGDYIPEELRGR